MKSISDFRPSMQKSYWFINEFVTERGYGPTIREIQTACNLSSTSVAHYHREALIKGGLLTYIEGHERSTALAGTLTLTFYGEDAAFIRDEFGSDPEAGIIQTLRETVTNAVGPHDRALVGWSL